MMTWKRGIFLSILFACMPFLMILAIQENGTLALQKNETIEEFLPYLLMVSVEDDFEMENIKAMAVIWRSNLMVFQKKNKLSVSTIKEKYVHLQKEAYIKNKEMYKDVYEACEATKGEILTYKGEVCYCPFFYASSGKTRDAFAFFMDERFQYVLSVPSYRDEECETYLSNYYFSVEEIKNKIWKFDGVKKNAVKGKEHLEINGGLENKKTEINGDFITSEKTEGDEIVIKEEIKNKFPVEVVEKDEAGYVKYVKVGDQIIGGEVFRYCLGLSSSCFEIEKQNDTIRIVCKGKGHGFGYSQFGANVMAKEGNLYESLLKHYFPELHIEKSV